MATALIKSGLRAATVQPIPSVIPRRDLEPRRLDICWPLAGCWCKRYLSRSQPRNGMAACADCWADGEECAGACSSTLAAHGGSFRQPCSWCSFRSQQLIALNEWRQPIQAGASICVIAFGIYRFFARRHPRALARIGPGRTGPLVFRRGDRSRCGVDACPDLSGTMPGKRFRLGAWADRSPDQRQHWNGGSCRSGPLRDDDLGRRCPGFLVYKHLGLKFVPQSWFNLDPVWAASLVLIGSISLASAIAA